MNLIKTIGDKKYCIRDYHSKSDFGFIFKFLSEESYWGRNISKDSLSKSLKASFNMVMCDESNNKQVAFARAITDGVLFGYIRDFFVLEEYRGCGIGSELMSVFLTDPRVKHVSHWVLSTKDAGSFYQKFGFHKLSLSKRYFEKIKD